MWWRRMWWCGGCFLPPPRSLALFLLCIELQSFTVNELHLNFHCCALPGSWSLGMFWISNNRKEKHHWVSAWYPTLIHYILMSFSSKRCPFSSKWPMSGLTRQPPATVLPFCFISILALPGQKRFVFLLQHLSLVRFGRETKAAASGCQTGLFWSAPVLTAAFSSRHITKQRNRLSHSTIKDSGRTPRKILQENQEPERRTKPTLS